MHTHRWFKTVLAAGMGVGMMFGFAAPAFATDSLGSQIVCFVFSELNGFGSPIPVLESGSCPGGSTPDADTATITVVKVVVNTGGGTKQVDDFPLFVNGRSVTSGVATTTLPGVHVVTETGDANYDSSFSSNCPAGVVVLAASDNKTCTITNTFHASPGGGSDSSDLSVTKTASSATPLASSTVTFTISVHNAGPDAATNVTVMDVLPTGLSYISDDGSGAYVPATGVWTVGTLGAASTTALHITARVTATSSGTVITNTASISNSDSTDSVSDNNTGSVDITVGSTPTTDDPDTGDPPGDTGGTGGGPGPSGNSGGGGGGGGGGGPSGDGIVLGASTETPVACSTYLLSYLHIGWKNNPVEVKKLQIFLNLNLGTNLPVTGFFGPMTFAAVETFQVKYAKEVLEPWQPYGLVGHTPTGFVYKTTSRQINNLMCPALNLPIPPLP